MDTTLHGFGGTLLGLGLQGFLVFFVWRMSRRLYPLIDAIKERDVTRAAAAVSADHGEGPSAIETQTI
ncbi:MAG: hypothetical protein R6X16_04260 [Anaerolineae bacterium]